MLTVLGLGFGTAHADNTVTNSSPPNGESINQSPDEILIGFAEELGETNDIDLFCEADAIAVPDPQVLDDGKTLSVELTEPLPSGTCTANWLVSNTDNEPNGRGSINFVVQNDTPTETVAPDADAPADAVTTPPVDGEASTVEIADTNSETDAEVIDLSVAGRGHASVWLARLISTIGIATLFGALFVITAAWPEGVEYLVTIKFLRAVWIVALIGTLLFTATAAGVVTPEAGGSGFSPSTWLDLLDAGWAGRALLLRLILLIGAGWVAFRPDRAIDPTTQLAALGVPGLCAALLGVSRTMGDLAALGVLMGIIHALAMSVWIGGVILAARVIVSGPGEEDLVHAVRGFSRVSVPAIAITIITGIIQMVRLDGDALFQSGHGRVVLLKVVVVAAMIFVAISARQFIAQRVNRAQQLSVPLADRLRRAFGAEAGIGVVTLALSSWLLAFIPPNIDPVPPIDYAVTQNHTVEQADFEVDISFTDNTVGLIGIEVDVKAPAEGISNLVVVLTGPTPQDGGFRQPVPLTEPGIAVRKEANGFPIETAGTWTVQVEALTPSGAVTSTAQTFAVLTADGTAVTTLVPAPQTSLVEAPVASDPASPEG